MTDKAVKAISERADNGIYSASNDRYGVACIHPWCDYCSFYCPRRIPDGD